ncbi:ASCH domain-containing protein [Hymenobacter sp. BT18]|uniref:ASCH domain-containing protein n=1 Tax=Hymenobacter sp. BT18 TaxID=2835648 RepID=UPI00143E845B|nr:ASCH domain-containing protein [Hymenobacter sp. BT18]QIX61841.1 ASCH domain-containing protein [Hymenobacter sp. BT18]
MKAISLLQPWASLIFLGYKHYETRSWNTSYRGDLAIHASLGKPAEARRIAATCPEISAILERHGLTFDTLPRGAVLGTCELADTHKTDDLRGLSITELACGDYGPGRYAWRLIAPFVCAKPVPCKGALSLWVVPEEVEQEVNATTLPF